MQWPPTEGQKQALAMVEALFKTGAPGRDTATITGYAGTGKTTMIKAIAEAHGTPIVLAPTGKAALRVSEATGLDAMTIHKWLYHPVEDSKTGDVGFRLQDPDKVAVSRNNLVIIDEASMVGLQLWTDLLTMARARDLFLLTVGDTFQLAPVETKNDDGAGFQTLKRDTPFKAHLTEVTRQALNSPIIRASMMIREQTTPGPALALLRQVMSSEKMDRIEEIYRGGGAIICHKNETRHRINAEIRARLGRGGAPQPGEPLLVLQNNYALERFNGEIVRLDQWDWANPDGAMPIRCQFSNTSKNLTFGAATIDGSLSAMICHEEVSGETLDMKNSSIGRGGRRLYADHHPECIEEYFDERSGTWKIRINAPAHLHANFGYALTAHKSQGSEWGKVLVLIEPSVRYTTYDGRRWTYTAVTRAKDEVLFFVGS